MPRPSRNRKPSDARSRAWPGLLLAVAAVVLVAWLMRPGARDPQPPAGAPEGPRVAAPAHARIALPGFLPAEAASVIQRIQAGAGFPHPQDGSVFGNRERRLPARAHGYYREYTVPTPGLGHRGARRIVTGGDPPVEWYYTADHYESFRPFRPPAMDAPR